MRLLPVAIGAAAGFLGGGRVAQYGIAHAPTWFSTGDGVTMSSKNILGFTWGCRLAVGLAAYAIATRVL